MLSSLALNGSSDALLIFNNGALVGEGAATFSLEAWIRTTTTGRRMQILTFGTEATGQLQCAWLFVEDAGRLAFDLSGWVGPRSDIVVGNGAWHHVGVVVDNGRVQLYVDGRASGPLLNCRPNIRTGEAWIGAGLSNKNTPELKQWRFAGSLSEVRVWMRALTAAEIANYARHRALRNAPGLVGYWPLSSNQDLSGKRYHLTIQGAPSAAVDPDAGPPEVPGSLVPTHLLSMDVQMQIRANMAASYDFANRIEAMGLRVPPQHMEAVAAITPEQWNNIHSGLNASPTFQAAVQDYMHKNLPLPQDKLQGQTERLLAQLGIASGVIAGISIYVLGLAGAISATGVGIVIGVGLGSAAGILGASAGVIAGIVTLCAPLVSTLEVGGQGGSVFNDAPKAGWKLRSISIRSGNWIDQIQCTWKDQAGKTYSGAAHGGSGGAQKTITLADDEYITEVRGAAGAWVDSLEFNTNRNKYGPYGGGGGTPFSLKPNGGRVIGFYGRSGSYLDAIGIQDSLFLHDRAYYGGQGGIPFIDDVSRMKQLKRILIHHGSYIDALQFEWVEEGNIYVSGPQYGGYLGTGGKLTEIVLNPDEKLTSISGITGIYLDGISFTTNRKTYGPFGRGSDMREPTDPQRLAAAIGGKGNAFFIDLTNKTLLAFIGRFGKYVDGFGVLTMNKTS